MESLLVFDLMDTVVSDPFFTEVPLLFGRPPSELHRVIDAAAWPAFETGQLSEEAFLQRLFLPGAPRAQLPTPERVRDAIVGSYAWVPGMEQLLAEVGAGGGPLWVLSNYPIWFEKLRSALELDRYFSDYVVSYRSGWRKPSAGSYEALRRATGRPPGEHLLIDDRPRNVEGARAAGMQAILFRGSEDLRHQLRQQRRL